MRKLFVVAFSSFFFVSVFSTDVSAMVECTNNAHISESTHKAYIAEAPNDPIRFYTVGVAYYCVGRVADGINYIEKASDMGSIVASYVLAVYHRSDKTGDVSKMVPEFQENYDAAIFYYERTADLIESTSTYPHGVNVDLPGWEGDIYLSARTYLVLTNLYYKGYVRAITEMLKNDVAYTDTIKVLTNMRTTAQRCLRRPSLSVWGGRQTEVAHSKMVKCKAYLTFAEKAFYLESQRIGIAKRCNSPLKECDEHKNIVSKLIKASKVMGNKLRSVPPI